MMMYDWIIFTSANGVKFLVDRLFALKRDVRSLKGPRVCAIGPKTAEALEALKIRVNLVPREYRAEAILEGLKKEKLKGKNILIPRARVARDVLPEELRKAGAVVDVVEVYQTVLPKENVSKIRELLKKGEISAVTFTSSSTVSNFAEMVGKEEARALTAGIPVASIGPITAEKAGELGIKTTVMPEEYTIPALVHALAEHFRKTDEPQRSQRTQRGKT
jgi:uroporphyrinogen III methyltransferase/synthase